MYIFSVLILLLTDRLEFVFINNQAMSEVDCV